MFFDIYWYDYEHFFFQELIQQSEFSLIKWKNIYKNRYLEEIK